MLGSPYPPGYRPRPGAWSRLSYHQRLVLGHVAREGMSNRGIAARMDTTEEVIKKTLTAIYGIVNIGGDACGKRVLLVRWAWDQRPFRESENIQ